MMHGTHQAYIRAGRTCHYVVGNGPLLFISGHEIPFVCAYVTVLFCCLNAPGRCEGFTTELAAET